MRVGNDEIAKPELTAYGITEVHWELLRVLVKEHASQRLCFAPVVDFG